MGIRAVSQFYVHGLVNVGFFLLFRRQRELYLVYFLVLHGLPVYVLQVHQRHEFTTPKTQFSMSSAALAQTAYFGLARLYRNSAIFVCPLISDCSIISLSGSS